MKLMELLSVLPEADVTRAALDPEATDRVISLCRDLEQQHARQSQPWIAASRSTP